VLYFNTPLEVCVARCLERAKTSGRSDDTPEIIHARLKTYEEQSKPVVEMYQKFGKVHEVDGSGDTFQVWNLTRAAMLPQVSFMIGPQVSGKESLASHLASRTNAKHLNFGQFVKEHELVGKDDDTVVLALIH
jgi:shikimate kinase